MKCHWLLNVHGIIMSKLPRKTGHKVRSFPDNYLVMATSRSLAHHDPAARNSGFVIALMARSRSFSRSAIRVAQLSGGSAASVSVSSVVGAGHTSSNASAISRENAATSFFNSRAAVLCKGVNRNR